MIERGKITMTNRQFVSKLQNIVDNYKTLYVMGSFGAPLTGANVSRYCTNHDYNKRPERTAMIKEAANKNPPIFGFDCVCLIKGVLWGWCGDASKTYGGAVYTANGVPDINANSMITKCTNVSTDFSKIEIGEALHCDGHIGVYIGNGKAIECTPSWKNCVQVTGVSQTGINTGLPSQKWVRHGKLPYITYEAAAPVPATIKVGDMVRIIGNTYASGVKVPAWVKEKTHMVSQFKDDRALLGANNGGICSWVLLKDIIRA